MSALALSLRTDCGAISAFIDELSALAEAREGVAQVGERLLDLIQAGAKAFVFETDRDAASDTGHLLVRAEPSDALLRLMSALRAGDIDLVVVEEALGHLGSSIPGLNHPAAATPTPSKTVGPA